MLTGVRRLPRPTVLAMVLLWAAYMIPAAFVIAVDPYELYPWGVRITPATRHDLINANRVTGIATADVAADTLLVGSSVTALVELDDIRATVPGTRIAWNLSYPGVAGADRQLVLDRIADRSRARRVLIVFDYIMAMPYSKPTWAFPVESYDYDPTNDLRVVDSRTLRETRNALTLGTPFPDRAASELAVRNLAERGPQRFRNPKMFANVARSLATQRATIDAELGRPCSAFPLLPPFEATVRRLAKKGRRVDVIMPVFSPALYYQWRVGMEPDKDVQRAFSLADQLGIRRCVVEALGGTPNVTISALDRDTALINDLSNFSDPAHLAGRENFRRQLTAIADPRYRLTRANIGDYVERYRRNVKAYCPAGPFPKGC